MRRRYLSVREGVVVDPHFRVHVLQVPFKAAAFQPLAQGQPLRHVPEVHSWVLWGTSMRERVSVADPFYPVVRSFPTSGLHTLKRGPVVALGHMAPSWPPDLELTVDSGYEYRFGLFIPALLWGRDLGSVPPASSMLGSPVL